MPQSSRLTNGFTLVEIMVVIVILTVFAGMMTLSVGSSDSQKNRAFYEHLQSNLAYIRLLSAENMQPYGLAIKPNAPATETEGQTRGELVVVKLANGQTISATTATSQPPSWQLADEIEPLVVPNNILLDIKPINATPSTSHSTSLAPMNAVFDSSQAPPIIWFGNGEATPVQIVVKKVNPASNTNANQTFDIGSPIMVNHSGAVEVMP